METAKVDNQRHSSVVQTIFEITGASCEVDLYSWGVCKVNYTLALRLFQLDII